MIRILNWLIKKFDLNVSDGYHTFKELYQYRMLYNALLFNEWHKNKTIRVHKSYKHSDGKYCFDSNGEWFIVVAELPIGTITNHYRKCHWNLFDIPSMEASDVPYDGHTPKDVEIRMYCHLMRTTIYTKKEQV